MNPRDAAIGALAAAAIALAALRARALTPTGALAAFAVGTLTFASGGIPFALVLLAFFLPSVALSRLGRTRKRELVDIGKHGPRDAMQVLANGGIATLCAVLWAATREPRWAWAFAGAYAAATADTWATEIGTIAKQQPRSILTLRPIPRGLSGGITVAGTLAEIAGAAWIGVVAAPGILLAVGRAAFLTLPNDAQAVARIGPLDLAAVPLAGFLGATLDSVLGAGAQELRHCDACGRDCETDPHACGASTRRVRGLHAVSNDAVNFAASAAGAVVAFALA